MRNRNIGLGPLDCTNSWIVKDAHQTAARKIIFKKKKREKDKNQTENFEAKNQNNQRKIQKYSRFNC